DPRTSIDVVERGRGLEALLPSHTTPPCLAALERPALLYIRLHHPRPKPREADPALRLERRRALDRIDRAAHELAEEERFGLRRDLVLARLPRHHDGDRQTASVQHRVDDGAPHL